MIRHIVDDVYQIAEYLPARAGVEAVLVYVLLNDGLPILIDCGAQVHRVGIMRELTELLDARAPEVVILTHSELPHAGNLSHIAREWPGVRVIVSNVMLPYIEITPQVPLANISTAHAGALLTPAGRPLQFVFALLKDQPGSQWIFDPRTGVLFCGDGFGYATTAADVQLFGDELPGGVSVAQFRGHHQTAFHYLRWVIPERFNADMDALFARHDVRVLAPIHGNAIRADIPGHVARLQQAVAEIRAAGVHA